MFNITGRPPIQRIILLKERYRVHANTKSTASYLFRLNLFLDRAHAGNDFKWGGSAYAREKRTLTYCCLLATASTPN